MSSETTVLLAGFAREDITPVTGGIPLAGYGITHLRLAARVLDPIYVNTVALADSAGDRAVLLTLDMISLKNELIEEYRAAISAATGLPEDRIFLGGTHTHSAPDHKSPLESMRVFLHEFLPPILVRAAKRALADLKPDYIYVPALVLRDYFDRVLPFVRSGATPVAVLPRIIDDRQTEEIYETLRDLYDRGIREALLGNMGHIGIARRAGMRIRGDFGLNAFNSQSLEVLRLAGFQSATVSFELRMSQIRDLRKPLDTEMIIYGRLPVMVSEQNIVKSASGKVIQEPGQLSDRMGSVFPVVQEYGDRSVIYNAHKLYMADKKEDLYAAGLWGLRLLFTTESGRECVEVAKGHLGYSDYRPNVLTRGVYYRGVE